MRGVDGFLGVSLGDLNCDSELGVISWGLSAKGEGSFVWRCGSVGALIGKLAIVLFSPTAACELMGMSGGGGGREEGRVKLVGEGLPFLLGERVMTGTLTGDFRGVCCSGGITFNTRTGVTTLQNVVAHNDQPRYSRQSLQIGDSHHIMKVACVAMAMMVCQGVALFPGPHCFWLHEERRGSGIFPTCVASRIERT